MKTIYCKLRGCPRLLTADTGRGNPEFAQCNQQEPDTAVWWTDCAAVSHERCMMLRKLLKRQEVQQ